MKLLDIVTTAPAPSFPKELSSTLQHMLDDASEAKANADVLEKAKRIMRGANNTAIKAIDEALAETERKRTIKAAELMSAAGALPNNGILSSDSTLARVNKLPVARLGDIVDVADRFGFAVFHSSYLHDAAYAMAKQEGLDHIIAAFDNVDSKYFKVYVVAPVKFYSPEKHINSGKDYEILAPRGWEQAFAAVGMMVPMMRSMKEDIEECRQAGVRNSRDLELVKKRMTKVETDIKALSSRVDGMHRQIERERLERLETERSARRVSQMSISLDPLMIALPADADIHDPETIVRIGPCWGPDFDDAVIKAMGITKTKGAEKAWKALDALAGLQPRRRQPHAAPVDLADDGNAMFSRNSDGTWMTSYYDYSTGMTRFETITQHEMNQRNQGMIDFAHERARTRANYGYDVRGR